MQPKQRIASPVQQHWEEEKIEFDKEFTNHSI